MARTFLFTNSQCDQGVKQVITPADYIIGVDGGINTLDSLNLVPNIIIGDFDSVNQSNKLLSQGILRISHPPEKDFTDTELAIEYALSQNFSSIIIVNDMQDRLDHVLGLIASLKHLKSKKCKSLILSNKQIMILLEKENNFTLPIDTTVSLIPLSDRAENITSSGLYYSLRNDILTNDRARGVSNIVCNNHVAISVGEGDLLFIINFNTFSEVVQLLSSYV